jgi:hypothetical protein
MSFPTALTKSTPSAFVRTHAGLGVGGWDGGRYCGGVPARITFRVSVFGLRVYLRIFVAPDHIECLVCSSKLLSFRLYWSSLAQPLTATAK